MTDLVTSRECVKSVAKRPWSTTELAELESLRSSGLGYQAIGKLLGRPIGSIASKLRAKGLQKPKKLRVAPSFPAAPKSAPALPPLRTVFVNPSDKRAGR